MSLRGRRIVESDIKIHKTLSRILIYKDYLLRKLLSPCDFPSGLHPSIMAGELFHENILKNFNSPILKLVYEGEGYIFKRDKIIFLSKEDTCRYSSFPLHRMILDV
jgi:hypothetical protein